MEGGGVVSICATLVACISSTQNLGWDTVAGDVQMTMQLIGVQGCV